MIGYNKLGNRESRRCIRCMLCFSVLSPVVCVADGLHEQRLFFTDQQRELLDSSVADVSSGKALADSSSAESAQQKTDAPTVDPSRIFYNGLVIGRGSIQLLINGLPCQPILLVESFENEQPGQGKPVDCPHLNNLPFNIQVHDQTEQVLVRLKNITKALLNPGESF